jgi:hypothetical protein
MLFLGPGFVLALPGIRRLVVRIKAIDFSSCLISLFLKLTDRYFIRFLLKALFGSGQIADLTAIWEHAIRDVVGLSRTEVTGCCALLQSYMRRLSTSKLSANEVGCTACSLLVISKNLCSKMHFQKGLISKPFHIKAGDFSFLLECANQKSTQML